MAYVKNLFDKNFIEYASYVIRDRAIPDIEDGLKPVQRRVLHTLIEKDDGKFHKVANVAGECMKYHPHGDASIYGALVVLANKDLFIDKQGNFGNLFTGDGAAAPRYIECRIRPFAKEVLYNPNITTYVPSYDGRNKEPVVFRAKLPLVLIMGAEGIAVGMSTKIMSHNIREVIEAEKACLRGEEFQLFPDFQTGGLMDVSDYQDGLGKIITRAKMDTSDPKRIVITELPYGSTTESLIASVESAAKSGKVKIASINDYTSDKVEVEIKLQRGVYSDEVVDSLYAFTECEQSVSCNLLVIKDNMPQLMTVTEIIKYHSKQLTGILKDELEWEKANLTHKLHLRTLERIFIEERIYKRIETIKTEKGVIDAVITGFEPYKDEILEEVTQEDVDHLLKIPIRRISLYDINKNRAEVKEITARLKEINKLLKNLKAYAISYLDSVLGKLDGEATKRKTTIKKFNQVDAKAVVQRDIALRYDDKTGYLGTSVSTGVDILKVTPYDRIFIMRKIGIYQVCDVPEKLFVDSGMWYCGYSDKESLSKVLFTIIYRDPKTQYAYIKRCRVEGYIMNRDYFIVPEGMEVLHIDTRNKFSFTLNFVPKPRLKILTHSFKAQDYEEKGLKAQGVRLMPREVESVDVDEGKTATKSASAAKSAPAEKTKPAAKSAPAKTATKTTKSASATKTTTKPAVKRVPKQGTLPEDDNPRTSVKVTKTTTKTSKKKTDK